MKKSIFIIATMALSIFSMNAEIKKEKNAVTIETVEITNNDLVQIFEWSVKSSTGFVSGTASSLEKAEEMIQLMSTTEIASEKKIESYYILRSDIINNSKRLYFWEVKSTNGFAKGFSSSEAAAEKMMQLVATGDIISSKIIRSGIPK